MDGGGKPHELTTAFISDVTDACGQAKTQAAQANSAVWRRECLSSQRPNKSGEVRTSYSDCKSFRTYRLEFRPLTSYLIR